MFCEGNVRSTRRDTPGDERRGSDDTGDPLGAGGRVLRCRPLTHLVGDSRDTRRDRRCGNQTLANPAPLRCDSMREGLRHEWQDDSPFPS